MEDKLLYTLPPGAYSLEYHCSQLVEIITLYTSKMKKSIKIGIIATLIGIAFAFAPPEPDVTALRIIGGGSQDYPLIKIEFYDLMVSQTIPRQTVSGGAEYFNLSTIYSLTQAESGHYKMKVYYRDNANQSWEGGVYVTSSSSNTSGSGSSLLLFWAYADDLFAPPPE